MEEFAQLRERLLSKQAIIDNAQKKLEQQEDDFQHQIQRIYLTIIEQLDAVETEERLKLLHTNEQFHADVTAYYKPINATFIRPLQKFFLPPRAPMRSHAHSPQPTMDRPMARSVTRAQNRRCVIHTASTWCAIVR